MLLHGKEMLEQYLKDVGIQGIMLKTNIGGDGMTERRQKINDFIQMCIRDRRLRFPVHRPAPVFVQHAHAVQSILKNGGLGKDLRLHDRSYHAAYWRALQFEFCVR